MEAENTPPKRTDNDTDSITHGTPSTGAMKLYVDTRTETSKDIVVRVNVLKAGLVEMMKR